MLRLRLCPLKIGSDKILPSNSISKAISLLHIAKPLTSNSLTTILKQGATLVPSYNCLSAIHVSKQFHAEKRLKKIIIHVINEGEGEREPRLLVRW